MQSILIFGIILITGYVFGEIATKIKLPKVTDMKDEEGKASGTRVEICIPIIT